MRTNTSEQVQGTDTLLSASDIEHICQQAQQEFPNDAALQEVHIARRILATEAQRLGLNYLAHIRQIVQTRARA